VTKRFAMAGILAVVALSIVWWLRTGSGPQSAAKREGAGPVWSSSTRVRVEVLNGGGRAGAARVATTFLRDAGYDVVYFGNAASFDYDSTRVIDRVEQPEVAGAVAQALGIGNVLSEPDPNLFVDVSVVLGADWQVETLPDVPKPRAGAHRWWDPRGWIGR
jgi:hypothetical protein